MHTKHLRTTPVPDANLRNSSCYYFKVQKPISKLCPYSCLISWGVFLGCPNTRSGNLYSTQHLPWKAASLCEGSAVYLQRAGYWYRLRFRILGPHSLFLVSSLLIFKEVVWDHYNQEVRIPNKYQRPGHSFELSWSLICLLQFHVHNSVGKSDPQPFCSK